MRVFFLDRCVGGGGSEDWVGVQEGVNTALLLEGS